LTSVTGDVKLRECQQPGVRPPLLQKWLAAFESTVVGERDYGSHTIFIGRTEAAYVSDKQVPGIYNLGADADGKRVFKGLEGAK